MGNDSSIDDTIRSNKRKELPSASSEDSSPLHKKQFEESIFEEEANSKMSEQDLKIAVESIKRTLDTLATKSDFDALVGEIEKIRNEKGSFSRGVNERIDKVESRVFDIEQKMEKVLEDNRCLREENDKLLQRVFQTERGLNDLEQYGRRSNLKVFNLPEDANETAEKSTLKVCEMITNTVGVEITS